MPRSMTGYGRGDVTRLDRRFIVEIKSVNHRYNEVSVRLPRTLNQFEESVRKMVQTGMGRGKTDVYISFESFAADDVSIRLNKPLAEAYVNALQELKNFTPLSDSISLNILTRFPDMFIVEKNIVDEHASDEIWEVLSEAVTEALSDAASMKEREGAALTLDILQKLDSIESDTKFVSEKAPFVTAEYRARLKEKISAALSEANFDENRFIMEITLFADKTCIDEEITRLLSHIAQMRGILDGTDAVGRKLDFLLQEMNREVNTIASKTNNLEITNLSVNMKSELEKIREQAQNIE